MHLEIQKLNLLQSHFSQLFLTSENTRLQPGADEPFYRAAHSGQEAVIFSRHNYYSSALHEISHWCIAGKERRLKDDFGYWYRPEGRTLAEQKLFEQVEVKPQAIEWALSLASDHVFHLSADNLSQDLQASIAFDQAVNQQLNDYLNQGLPARAQLLFERLLFLYQIDKCSLLIPKRACVHV